MASPNSLLGGILHWLQLKAHQEQTIRLIRNLRSALIIHNLTADVLGSRYHHKVPTSKVARDVNNRCGLYRLKETPL